MLAMLLMLCRCQLFSMLRHAIYDMLRQAPRCRYYDADVEARWRAMLPICHAAE